MSKKSDRIRITLTPEQARALLAELHTCVQAVKASKRSAEQKSLPRVNDLIVACGGSLELLRKAEEIAQRIVVSETNL